jgi:hypothetical protein
VILRRHRVRGRRAGTHAPGARGGPGIGARRCGSGGLRNRTIGMFAHRLQSCRRGAVPQPRGSHACRSCLHFLGAGGLNHKQEAFNQEQKHVGEGEMTGYVRLIAQSSRRKRTILGGSGGGGRRVGSNGKKSLSVRTDALQNRPIQKKRQACRQVGPNPNDLAGSIRALQNQRAWCSLRIIIDDRKQR